MCIYYFSLVLRKTFNDYKKLNGQFKDLLATQNVDGIYWHRIPACQIKTLFKNRGFKGLKQSFVSKVAA